MEDKKIIELYESRSETAIAQTAVKYGTYLETVASNILANKEDADECVSDVYFKLWNSIPPQKPVSLKLFAAKITRNNAIDRYMRDRAQKRGSGSLSACLDELAECVSTSNDVEESFNESALTEIINGFLEHLPSEQRVIFVKRYYFAMSIKEIAVELCCGESKVKTSLLRMRNSLKELLVREGIEI